MADLQSTPPVLSTPGDHILTETTDSVGSITQERLSDEELEIRYEIDRTITEIRRHKWRRAALQFPDEMLPHSARVYQTLARGLGPSPNPLATTVDDSKTQELTDLTLEEASPPVKLTILADTSYGSCCVDEIAAEHIDADAIVHYGRACLSPTARLPVLHIYTHREIDYREAVDSFKAAFPNHGTKVILTADMPYASHIQPLCERLSSLGYTTIFAASIIHDPSSLIPNRTLPSSITSDPSSLQDWSLFHISTPPTSLLLTLHSRLANIVIYPANATNTVSTTPTHQTSLLLRRRYALLTALSPTQIWGILINTLSVSNYMSIITHIQNLLSLRNRRSYLFVVGKINPAKLANFSEIGGWVVVGCWESSLIDSKEFYRPIITPFELEMALTRDEERVWGKGWRGDFESVLSKAEQEADLLKHDRPVQGERGDVGGEEDSEDEPPEYDLRTGRYISRPKSTRLVNVNAANRITAGEAATALVQRSNGALVTSNGIASPAAKFLREQRTWRGLGSDFEIRYEDGDGDGEEEQGALVEEGQTGVAGGYAVGGSEKS